MSPRAALPWLEQPIHTSSFGVIPKRHQYNKWRLIIDLSSPRGRSVNDGIDRSMSLLAYILVADIASAILSLGPGSLLAKSDVKHAYRQNPDDRPLLGMRWQGQLFCNATLPFGLRSAPLIVADALEWVLRSKGASNVFHYVDDFVFIGPPGTDKCRADLQLFKDTCSMLIAEDKTEGHGAETAGRQARSTQRRPPRVARQTRRFTPGLGISGGAIATRHPGGSPWSGVPVPPLQSPRPDGIVQAALFGPLEQRGSGGRGLVAHTSMLRPLRAGNPDVEIWSDASGSWGCGALWHQRWLQLKWEGLPIVSESTAAKELFPVVVAAAVWGREWRGAVSTATISPLWTY